VTGDREQVTAKKGKKVTGDREQVTAKKGRKNFLLFLNS
jgi:hypothetical protein